MKKLRSQVRNAEVDGLSDTLIRVFRADEGAQTDAFLVSVMAELETLSAGITSAILQDRTLSRLDEADSARDEAFHTLGTVLAAYAVIPIPGKRELAAPLKAVHDKYAKAGITGANYASQSSLTESLLEDLADPALAAGIAGLEGVAESVALIREAQDEFNRANDEYVRANATKAQAASSYNKPIVSLVNDRLVPYLSAMRIAGNAVCEGFAAAVEAEIERTNASVSARRTKASAAEDAGRDG